MHVSEETFEKSHAGNCAIGFAIPCIILVKLRDIMKLSPRLQTPSLRQPKKTMYILLDLKIYLEIS